MKGMTVCCIEALSLVVNVTDTIQVLVIALFSLMAFRAFRSGSTLDYLLGTAQAIGLALFLCKHIQFASYLLLVTAVAYFASQIATGARPVSRLLPLAGAISVIVVLVAAMGFD